MPLRFEMTPQSEIVQLVAPLPEVVRRPTGLPLAILSLAVMTVAAMALA